MKVNFSKLNWELDQFCCDGFIVKSGFYSYYYEFCEDWLLPDYVSFEGKIIPISEKESLKLRKVLRNNFLEVWL